MNVCKSAGLQLCPFPALVTHPSTGVPPHTPRVPPQRVPRPAPPPGGPTGNSRGGRVPPPRGGPGQVKGLDAEFAIVAEEPPASQAASAG